MKAYSELRIERGIPAGEPAHTDTFLAAERWVITRDGDDVRVERGAVVKEFPWGRVVYAEPVKDAPAAPSGGGYLYVEDGPLKYRGPTRGAVITLGGEPATPPAAAPVERVERRGRKRADG